MSDVVIEVEVKSDKAGKDLQKLEGSFKKIEKQATDSSKAADKGLSKITKYALPAAAAVASLGAAFTTVIDDARALEDLETQFISFTGSAESAAKQVERIAQFSASTPFQLEDLANANRTLLAFGSSTEESLVQLKQLGEAAAATGNNVSELATIFGQIQAAGKLTGERFNQLVERGINIGPALAESLGVAESELVELRKQGKITSDDVAKAFATMTTDGGQFAGAMERQSKTLSGALSTAADNVFLLSANIGKQLSPLLISLANSVTEVAQEFNKWLGTSNSAEIARIDENIADLNRQLEETKNKTEDLQQSSGGGFLGTTVADIKNAGNEIDGSISQIEQKIADLQAKRAELAAQPPAEERQQERQESVQQGADNVTDEAKKINEELIALRKQRSEIEAAQSEADNAALIEQLELQKQTILEKEQEKNIALLEEEQKYQEASLLLAQQKSENAKKARQDEFNFEKQTAKAQLAFDQQTWQQRARTTQVGLGAIAALQSTGNKQAFEIGKAAAAAQVLIDTPLAAMKAYTSLVGIPVVGPVLAPAAAAAAVAVGAANLSRINSQSFTGYADGGVVTGGIPGQDSVPAMLTPGEVVVPEKNFEDIGLDNSEQVGLLKDIKSLLMNQQEQTEEIEVNDTENTTPLTVNLTLNEEVLASQMLEISRNNLRTA